MRISGGVSSNSPIPPWKLDDAACQCNARCFSVSQGGFQSPLFSLYSSFVTHTTTCTRPQGSRDRVATETDRNPYVRVPLQEVLQSKLGRKINHQEKTVELKAFLQCFAMFCLFWGGRIFTSHHSSPLSSVFDRNGFREGQTLGGPYKIYKDARPPPISVGHAKMVSPMRPKHTCAYETHFNIAFR